MRCEYCIIFNTATIRTKSDRYCTVVHRSVAKEDEGCLRFEPYHIAWCPKNGYQIDNVACIARQNNGVDKCQDCRQGQRLKHIERLQKKKVVRRKAEPVPEPLPLAEETQVKRRLSRYASV